MKLTIKAMETQACPKCHETGMLRQVLYGMTAGPLDEKRYVSAGCTMMGNDPDVRCIDCGWEGFRAHFPEGETIDTQGRLIMTGVHEPGHSDVLTYSGEGLAEHCYLDCECGVRLEIESFRHPWSTIEVRVKYGQHLNAVLPGLGDKYIGGK
jgi:hypothetical protein